MSRAIITIKVRDVLGVKAAEFELGGLVLVGGRNGAGKSSLLQTTAALLLRQWPIRGMSRKADVPRVVREGAETGSAVATWQHGSTRVLWTTAGTAEVQDQGKPLEPDVTSLALGNVPFMSLPQETRQGAIQNIWQATPSREDIAGWCRANPSAGIDPDAKPQPGEDFTPFSLLCDDLDEQGWHAIHRRADAEPKRLAGAWREVTGQTWGDKRRLTWAPAGLYADETYSLDEAKAGLAARQAEADEMRSAAALDAGRLHQLQAEANTLPQIQQEIAALREGREERARTLERLQGQVEKMGRPADPRLDIVCPHCGKGIKPRRGREGEPAMVIEKMGQRQTMSEYETAKAAYDDLVERVSLADTAVKDDDRKLVLLLDSEAKAKAARRRYEEASQQATIDPAERQRILEAVTAAEQHLDRVKRLRRSQELNAEYDRAKLLADMLAPDGLRETVLQRRVAEINGALGAISTQAAMSEVALLSTGDLTYDGRAYALLSESEQWRCNFVMARAIGQHTGVNYQIVDRLDVLEPQARPGVLKALHQRGVAALIAMTQMDYSKVPDLQAAKMGRSYWIEAGELQRIAPRAAA